MNSTAPEVTPFAPLTEDQRLALVGGDTYLALLVEHGSPLVPLTELAERYLGINPGRAAEYAKRGNLALPAIRIGRQKAPWLVHLHDLAALIDAQRGAEPAAGPAA